MADSVRSLSALRARLAAIGDARPDGVRSLFPTGHAGLDAALGGGFPRGRVHEVFGEALEDAGSAGGFALALALLAGKERAEKEAGPLLWLRTDAALRRSGLLYGPGLVEFGGDPARLLLAVMPGEEALLRAAVDALRCRALGAVVVECWGDPRLLDLTASRRLALAAEASGVTALLLRMEGHPAPSAAETRWRVAAAPSAPLAGNTPGHCAFDINLLRRRAGPDGLAWRLEWNRDRCCFEEPALSGAVVPLSADGPAADRAAGSVGAAA